MNTLRPTVLVALLSLTLTAQAAAPSAPDARVAATMATLRVDEAPQPQRSNPRWHAPRKVLLLAQGNAAFAAQAAAFGAVAPGARIVIATDRTMAAAEAVDADVIIGFNPTVCDARILDGTRELRWLVSLSAGVENCVGLRAVREPGMLVTNMRGVDSPAIAEHAVAMVMALAHGLDAFAADTARGHWGNDTGSATRMIAIDGKTLLVSGLGGIGTEVARRAAALGMKVIATREGGGPVPPFVAYVGQPAELLTLAAQADVVVSAVPLTPATTGLYDKRFFAALPRGALFVNVARGASVVTDDLVQALNSGQLGGAGLDVTEPEPLPAGHPLWRAPRVLISPHIASRSDLPGDSRWILAIENLRRYAAGERMLLVVDPQRGY
jgi:phosphoglycerate dehydrogenase-like enzyme